MRIHIIACRVFSRELCAFAATSPHIVDITWLPQGLHMNPAALRARLCEMLQALHIQWEEEKNTKPQFIVLGYGLCSNGIVGLESKDISIIIPKTDDCIAQFMGSQELYQRAFVKNPGTYWLNNGWVEQGQVPSHEGEAEKYKEYCEEYGEDNAEYLMEIETAWKKEYKGCCFIESPVCRVCENEDRAKELADTCGWRYFTMQGDCRMIKAMTHGEWNETEYLICSPMHRIEATGDEQKIRAVPAAL